LTVSGGDAQKGRWAARRWRALRSVPSRTPLRIKLITLLFALVAIALSVIGFVTVAIFTGYLQSQDNSQVTALYNQIQGSSSGNPFAPHEHAYVQPTNVVEILTPTGQVVSGFGNPSNLSLPAPVIPTSQSWLSANGGRLVTVPSASGDYNWRVIVQPVTYTNALGSQSSGILVVGVNLLNIDQTIAYLIKLDVIVSVAILLVLVVLGVAVVRANLRALNDIELSAGQIAQGHLDHRVPEGDPRTEVGSLSRSLNAMLTQIERAFHAQQESEQAAHDSEERMRRFIADASHELRTPLTTIRGFAAHYRMRGGAGGLRSAVNGGQNGRSEDQEQSSRTDAFVPASASVFSPAGAPPGGPARDNGSGLSSPDGMPPEELDHLIGRVEAEATRMGLLVEDLLTLARLDQQRPLNIAPVDVLTLAADAVQDARIVSPGRSIDLIVAPGTAFLVDGDEQRLRQVLGNLVNNAITHTPAGTPVRVKIGAGTLPPVADGHPRGPAQAGENGFAVGGGASASREPVPAVVLDVEDDGPGMPAEQAQRVFERFYRADAARNRASGGTGLGLAIVAGLVNAHGGTVSVRTAPGRGADFQVRLPLSPDALASSDDPDDTLPD
jgi:two-component system OmpR family sensor kinase